MILDDRRRLDLHLRARFQQRGHLHHGHRRVARWWDLESIAAEYRGYLEAWSPRRRAAPRRAPAAAFADYLLQLDGWRRIPFHDPGLPAAALPADWPGSAAWALFAELSDRLGAVALDHVEARAGTRARAA